MLVVRLASCASRVRHLWISALDIMIDTAPFKRFDNYPPCPSGPTDDFPPPCTANTICGQNYCPRIRLVSGNFALCGRSTRARDLEPLRFGSLSGSICPSNNTSGINSLDSARQHWACRMDDVPMFGVTYTSAMSPEGN